MVENVFSFLNNSQVFRLTLLSMPVVLLDMLRPHCWVFREVEEDRLRLGLRVCASAVAHCGVRHCAVLVEADGTQVQGPP